MTNGESSLFVTVILMVIGLFVYFIPSGIAGSRKHNNAGAIFILNLLLGWSCLGWVIAIVWAHTDNVQKE